MQEKLKTFWRRIHPWVAVLVAVLGAAFFLVRALRFSQATPTIVWDESMYPYKGWLFAIGRYRPFEDFGPWTNQMPVAFLVPGYIQKWFGPGMAVARTYAVAVGMLTVLGVWLAVKRTSNVWWAAAAVWVMALNSSYVQVFSQTFSQGLVSLFFAWMLFFGLGDWRPNWSLALAAFLAALAGMARINVLPALPLFVLYVFWQHGKRAGWIALAAGMLPVVFFHIAYWPDILKIWAYWIPPQIFPWIMEFRSPWREIFVPEGFSWWPISTWLHNPDHLAWVGIRSFWQAVRGNFVIIFGVITGLLLYAWRGKSTETHLSPAHKRQIIFLAGTFWSLFLVHLWAANGKSCQFVCFPGYILFFFVFGLVLIPMTAAAWKKDMPVWGQALVFVFLFALLLTLEFNLNSPYLNFRYDLIRNTFDLQIPRIKDGHLLNDTAPLWQLLENKFGFDHYPLRRYVLNEAGAITLLHWLKIGAIVLLGLPLAYRLAKKRAWISSNFGRFALLGTLLLGFGFSYGHFFGDVLISDTCDDSVVASYEQVGEELSAYLSDGDQVYYRVKANMLLLELPAVEIYPPQLNFLYTFVDDPSADPETLTRFVWWNQALKETWLQEADYILVENRFFDQEWKDRIAAGELEQLFISSPTASCRGEDSRIVLLAPLP